MPSKYFSLKELTRSEAAIRHGYSNTPDAEEEAELWALVEAVLDPLREALGHPLRVNSAYRGPQANAAVGGAKSSQHMKGQAADVECDQLSNKELAQMIIDNGYPFDQLILEFYSDDDPHAGWVHVSHCKNGHNRKEVLTAYKKDGKTKYVTGLGIPQGG
jgi:hypothetical protein